MVTRLTPAEREAVVDVLRGGIAPHRHPIGNGRTDAAKLGAALIPDASSSDQQAVEAELLRAVLRVAEDHLLFRHPVNPLRRAHALEQVRPGAARTPQGITVTLAEPAALGPLLWELLPQHQPDAGEVYGAVGVRVEHDDQRVHVTRLGTTAAISIARIGRREWLAALEYMQHVCDDPRLREAWLWEQSPDTITNEELKHRQRYPRRSGPADLASSLLRRLHVLHRCRVFTGWPTGGQWKIVTAAGPAPQDIMAALLHPLFGLPGPFRVDCASSDRVVVASEDDRYEIAAGKLVPVELALQRGDRTDLTVESRLRDTALEGPWPQWTAWEMAWQARNSRPVADAAVRAAARAAVTGEMPSAARAGVGPDGAHGLDDCSDAQLALRARLALHTFNGNQQGLRSPHAGSLYAITHYTMTISPRFDDLVIFTDAPDNLTNYFARDSNPRVPGIRLVERPNGGTFRLQHMPSGATMTITSRAEADFRTTSSDGPWPTRHWWGPDMSMTEDERAKDDQFSSPPPDAATLIAAVWLRMSTKDVHDEWATGTWFHDPLDRLDKARLSDYWLSERRLVGEGDSWELRWSSVPLAFDVVASIVDPAIGLPDVTVEERGAGYAITYRAAELSLRPL